MYNLEHLQHIEAACSTPPDTLLVKYLSGLSKLWERLWESAVCIQSIMCVIKSPSIVHTWRP